MAYQQRNHCVRPSIRPRLCVRRRLCVTSNKKQQQQQNIVVFNFGFSRVSESHKMKSLCQDKVQFLTRTNRNHCVAVRLGLVQDSFKKKSIGLGSRFDSYKKKLLC